MIVLTFIILAVGVLLLVKGADYFVDGAAAFAGKLNVPGFIVGMTVVAMGTSTPEVAVTITASIRGNNGMALGNVIGSNLFNLLVVCGVCALITPLAVKKRVLKREFPVSVLAEIILLVMGAAGLMVGHVEGIILLGLCAVFLVWTVRSAKKAAQAGGDAGDGSSFDVSEFRDMPNLRCFLFIVLGAAAIVLGGWLVVRSAETIVLGLGMSETLSGLTICAIGTSLPELVASIAAARKKHAAMAIGNVIGSNIFNIFLVAGVATAISPIAVTRNNLIDLVFLIAVSVLFLLIVWKRQELRRGGAVCLLAVYAAYFIYICFRDTGVLPAVF